MAGLSAKYSGIEPVLRKTAQALEKFLLDNVPSPVHVDRVQVRHKALERFVAKAGKKDRGEPKYENPFSDIQDIVGARVVVLYLHEVDVVSSHFSSLLSMIEQVDKEPEGFSEFGYVGWHGIVRLPEEVLPCAKPEDFPVFFELQIKTLFQHAWAEAEHDIAYKQFSGDLTPRDKRMIAYAAAQAWGADNAFSVVLDELQRRRARDD
jgi:ppGpp synthetase/RelA/SpoT-type nucleotidyltranferase